MRNNLYLQSMIPHLLNKRFDIFCPQTGGYSEGLDAFIFFFKQQQKQHQQQQPEKHRENDKVTRDICMSNVKEKKYDKTLAIVIVVEVVATFRACSSAPLQRHYFLLPLGPVLTSR